MRRLLILIPFLCCLGCQQGEKVAAVDVEADIRAIRLILAEMNSAFNASNIDSFMEFFAEDATDIPANEPSTVGKEAIKANIQELLTTTTFQEQDSVKDIKVSGNIAVAHVAYASSFTNTESGESGNVQGNWLLVFEKNANDGWRIIYSIFSDESLVHPNQAE
jgi:uncharacterized protein (TIGR02246 family)